MVLTMASSPRGQREEERRQREEERRVNLRTLAIASIASAVAAAVTSQLWFAGTWLAAAITPVLVSLVSELLHRPTEVIARARTSDRRVVRDRAAPTPRVTVPRETGRERGRPSERPPGRPDGQAAGRPGAPAGEPDPAAPRPGEAGPVRIYRQPTERAPRRRIAYGVVAATAAIAFVIGVVALTTTELIAGESIGRSGHRTSIGIGGGSDTRSDRDERDRQPTDTSEQREEDEEQQQEQQEQQEQQQRQPAETDEEEQPPPTTETTPTTPTVPEEEPPTQTAPRETPAPPQTRTAPAP
jgi:hypothetical protein